MSSVLLIHPPLVKPSEPPAGLARLAGALRRHRIPCTIVDANIEGLLFLLGRRAAAGRQAKGAVEDVWTKRACRHLEENLDFLRTADAYRNIDRYTRAVMDINRTLAQSVPEGRFRLSLSDYEDRRLTPVSSRDLIAASAAFQENPFYEYFQEMLQAVIKQGRPSWIGVSLNYLSQALCSFAIIGVIRRSYPDIKIVLGGGLITTWMHLLNENNPFQGLVDMFISGEGEAPLLKLLGITDDDSPAVLDYTEFPLSQYLSPPFILPYNASTGCYWRQCAFCPEKAEANPYRPLPHDRVIGELATKNVFRFTSAFDGREIYDDGSVLAPDRFTDLLPQSVPSKNIKPVLIHLLDNALSPSLLKRMISEPPGAPWYGFVRVSAELADVDFCRGLKRAGCVMLKLGIESGSHRVLERLRKGIDPDMAVETLKALQRAGIAAYVYLLFGTPPEEEQDAFRTLDFVVSNQDAIDFLNVAVFNLPAVAQDAEKLYTADFYAGDLSVYRSFRHPSGWDRRKVRNFLGQVFKRHPAVAAILRRDPPFFTSSHAPLFGLFGK